MPGTAAFRSALADALPERPFRVVLWDGTDVPSTEDNGGPTFTARSPQALAHILRAPGELGLGRAYVTGALDVDDLDALVELADGWEAPPIGPATKARLALAALRATGPVRPPHAPPSELAPKGRFHSIARDSRAVRHHYDLPPEFFRLFLGPSMTYSCAIFSRGATTLEEAQEAKHELICRKLELKRGQHVLDVGCGWGSFAIHAAQRHGVHVTGITLSPPQAETARRRAAEAGVADRTDFRVADYRELAGESFDAVASIGMVEHVGGERMDEYAQRLRGALRPGAPLLNHGIANLRQEDPRPGAFSSRYVFPDGAPQPLSRVLVALERARPRDPPHRGVPRGLRRDAAPLGAPARRERRGGGAARGRRARAGVAPVPARGAQRLRDRLHVGLPGPRVVIGEALVRVRRGAGVESEHRVAWATTDPGGGRARGAGSPSAPYPGPVIFARSAAKPFQALAGVRAGVPERFGLETEHLALACASHGGGDLHVRAGARDPRRRRALGGRPRLRRRRAARPGGRDRAARGRRAARAGAPQLLGQARVRAGVRERRGLAGRGLHRQGAPAAGRDGGRHGGGHRRAARRARARDRRLRDAHVLDPDRAARRGVRPARLRRPRRGRRPAGGGDDARIPSSSPTTARSTPS